MAEGRGRGGGGRDNLDEDEDEPKPGPTSHATQFDKRLVCTVASLAQNPGRVPWCIRQTAEMGRACFATEDLAADQTIAYDAPILTWAEDETEDEAKDEAVSSRTATLIRDACHGKIHTSVVNLLAAYVAADEETRRRYDDVARAPTDEADARMIAPMTKVWTHLATQIWESGEVTREIRDAFRSPQGIVDTCTRSHLNAHGLQGRGHGMFEVGSKFNHSCRPNCTYNQYTVIDGRPYMRIFTIRAIKKGDQIFTTYIAGTDMLGSTRARRKQLMAAKAFYCRCERCLGPDVLAPLPCPSCQGRCLRYDHVEHPWHCADCGLRWWDAEITGRERQLNRLVLNLDAEMDGGRFPPLQIVQFVVKDCLEDLGAHHYLSIRARLLLEESYAMREMTNVSEPQESLSRLANAWHYIDFVMTDVWKISPVVATNLSVLRIRTVLGHERKITRGLPKYRLQKHLIKAKRFLQSFWGPDDQDVKLIEHALREEMLCCKCRRVIRSLFLCGGCATAAYCSRECQLQAKGEHLADCQAAIELSRMIETARCYEEQLFPHYQSAT